MDSKNLSSEEEDVLAQDQKKIKWGDDDFTEQQSFQVTYEDIDLIGARCEVDREPESFKEALTGSRDIVLYDGGGKNDAWGFSGNQTENSAEADKDSVFRFEKGPSGDESCFMVSIDKHERQQMGQVFNKTLIIKLLGKTVGFKFLEKKLHDLWA